MLPSQFRALYRQFLFRVFDPEMLSTDAHGDANRLLGQFGALLVWISIWGALAALLSSNSKAPWNAGVLPFVITMVTQHFLIATTMLVVGLFAVLSWDATFPDRLDVMVLTPLPIPARMVFLAKTAAVASSLALAVLILHSAMGLVWPMIFAARAAPATLPSLRLDPTPAPVSIRNIQAVMNHDLAQALTTGELSPGSPLGMTIGVVQHGERRIFSYGTAQPDSLFEIGSITKTFTGLILARMVDERRTRLDEPVRLLLPAGTVAKPSGPEITLLDLATHHSGLPRMPDNFHPQNRDDPYADYGSRQLYEWLSSHGVEKPDDASFLYSNLGVGLLGQALAVRSGRSYAELLRDQVTAPLGMDDTQIVLSEDGAQRFLQGHDFNHEPVHAWNLDALAGAGAIRSTAADLLTYLEAQLHPENVPALASALNASHRVRDRVGAGQFIALAWLYDPDAGSWQHDGATAGYTSGVFFNPALDAAAVVLLNSGPNQLLSSEEISDHIGQRLAGRPAYSLDTVVVAGSEGFPGVVRSYAAYWLTMFAAGAFVFGAILGIQGLAALLLPRRIFLRISGYLQTAAIFLILGVYFFQPGFGGFDDFNPGSFFATFGRLPSYWFLAFYQQLNGSLHPVLAPLAHHAWIGLACTLVGTPVIYALCWLRTVRRIAEEPDITPAARRLRWSPRFAAPRFGSQRHSAIVQFALRTLARSRRHRLILAFYLGIGLAFVGMWLKFSAPDPALDVPTSLAPPSRETLQWGASTVMMVLAIVGTRIAFAIPLDLRANWIWRITPVRAGRDTLAATRLALLLISAAPVWIVSAFFCRPAAHLTLLALVGLIVTDLCLAGFRKIPFTCSWLPGKTRFNITLFASVLMLSWAPAFFTAERRALRDPFAVGLLLTLLFAVWLGIHFTSVKLATEDEAAPTFEEEEPSAIETLGLYRDGILPIEPAQ